MPDLGVPPGVPPEDYQSFLQAQRRQMLANALMQGAFTPLQAPETSPTHGVYVQPRMGKLQAISKLGEALLANKAGQEALTSQAGLFQALNQAYAPGGQPVSPGTPLEAAPPAADPNAQGVQPLIQRAPGQSLAQTVQGTQPTYSPTNPRNPMGLPADVVRNLAMSAPADYAKMLQGPEAVQLGRIAGIAPATAAGAALSKQTQTEIRPGVTVVDPISGRTMIGADPAKGEYYAIGSNGQVAAFPIENDATLQAWRAGLTTAAQQANTPRNIPMGGGVEKLGYPPPPPALAGTGPAPGPQNAPGLPATAPVAAPAGGPASGGAPGPIAMPAATSPWASIPKLQIPSSPGQTSNTFQSKNLENAAAKHADLINTYGQEAKLADQQLQYNKNALAVLPNASVGPMSEWLTNNRSRLKELGVPDGLIPGGGQTVTPTLELNKYLLNSALQGARQIYGPRMTQNEVKLQTEEMSPSAHMTADAIASLVGQNNIQANYAKQRAADYSRYANMGGDPMQFESWYSQHRPLTRFASESTTPPQALQRLQQNPKLLPDFKARYGWDPTQ